MSYWTYCNTIRLLCFLSASQTVSSQDIDSLIYEAYSFEYLLEDSHMEGYDTNAVYRILTGKYDSSLVHIDSVFRDDMNGDDEIIYLGHFNTGNGARYKLIWYLKFPWHDQHQYAYIVYDRILVFDNSNELIGYYDFQLKMNIIPQVFTERKLTNGVLSLVALRENYDCYMPDPAITDLTIQFPTNLNTKFCGQHFDWGESDDEPMPIYFIPVH